MNELWTLTLMSDKGLKSEDSVMSSLSRGSWRQMGPLYVRLTVRSGCMEEFRSRELPGQRKWICHSETKRHHTYPLASASPNRITTRAPASCPSGPPRASAAALTGRSGVTRTFESGALAFPADSLSATEPKPLIFQSSLDAIFSKTSISGTPSGNKLRYYCWCDYFNWRREALRKKKRKKDALQSSLEEK